MRKLTFTSLLLLATFAQGATLSASCADPSGRALGFRGELGKFAQVDEADGMRGGVVGILWEVGASEAAISIKPVSGSVFSNKGVLAFQSSEQVTFVVLYPTSVYLYSLFPASSTLLMSEHALSLGIEPKSAIAKSFQAKCELTVR